jgi:drug/metabolite transporter (DMT)-like permease
LQASAAPLLVAETIGGGYADAFAFATALVGWRLLWSSIGTAGNSSRSLLENAAVVRQRIFWVRTALTVATQATFILAVGSTASSAAWPILNSTALFSLVLASVLLGEKPALWEVVALVAVVGLGAARYIIG